MNDILEALTLRVVGPESQLEHRARIDRDVVLLDAEVHPGQLQELSFPPAFLTAALVRLTRMRPRRPDDTGPDFSWELEVEWEGGSRRLAATDGPSGIRLTDPVDGSQRPASNTEVYRILSTLLTSI